ncbi:glutamine amidotransferase, partial [Priestia megaterium]
DILNKLNVLKSKELEEWYALFKNGFIPITGEHIEK